MSDIVKTEAFVLGRINFRDSSNIVSLFTKGFGKLSAIVKGARNPKNKIGLAIDPPNHLQIIMYKKDNRDLQLLTGADIISHYSHIKSDLEKLKYVYAILELVNKLIPENESNLKLFTGLERIFHLYEAEDEPPIVLFGRFFMFFLKEIGYEVQLDKCISCGKSNLNEQNLAYNFELGILCESCKSNYLESFSINSELFEYLLCLKNNKKFYKIDKNTLDKAIKFMGDFLKYHIPDFKGFQSFQYLN